MTTAAATPEPEQIPLSFHQTFLTLFEQGDEVGPFGPRYSITGAWRIRGEIDVDALQGALDDVVARHEALRTVIVRDGETKYQQIAPPCSRKLIVRDLSGVAPADRERRAEELYNEVEASTISIKELPLLQGVLGRFDEADSLLVLHANHTAADAWSMHIVMRDLAVLYATRRGLPVPALGDVTQYQEFARWEQTRAGEAAVTKARNYWRVKLDGAQITPIRTDRPRTTDVEKLTAWRRFAIDADLASASAEVANELRSSPFMVLLAAYNVFLQRRTGVSDVVVPTFSLGRGHARFQETVGAFINFLPLRTDLSGCETFRDAVARTRATCFEAYSHDIPFVQVLGEAPMLMAPLASDDLQVAAFQVAQSPFATNEETVGDIAYSKLWKRLVSQPVGSDIPDGVLWTLHIDPSGEMVGSVGFNTNRFDASTMDEMLGEFLHVLRATVTAPDAPLTEI